MKQPMTTEELFDKISGILKEKGKLPEILDYGLATCHPVPIRTYEFELKNNLNYGGCEGIYLDLWIEVCIDGKFVHQSLGTFKTLGTGDQDMHIMAGLLADFIIEEADFVNANMDDFTWEGAEVYPCNEAGEHTGWGYSCRTMESGLKKKDELLRNHEYVVVRNNATRKETIYHGEETMKNEEQNNAAKQG